MDNNFRDDKFQQMQKQSAYFNKKAHESKKEGTPKKGINVGQTFGGFQYGGKGEDGKHRFHKADSSQVQESDKAAFDSTMDAHAIMGQRELYTPEQKPSPRLMDSVFMQFNPQEINSRPQTRLAGRVVCVAGKGCTVQHPFGMDGMNTNSGGVQTLGHMGKGFTGLNEAAYLAQTGNRGDEKNLQNSWNAGDEVNPALEQMTAQGDTAKVSSILDKMKGIQKPAGGYFKTEMVKDTIPESAQMYDQETMEGMRQTGGSDGKNIRGFKDINEAKRFVKAGQSPAQMQALSAFEQRIANTLKKKP